jgi:ubiquinone/menaquinone biosynthesis C-methylase UbiE
MLPRTLEPEVMDTAQEAEDYDAMDHAQVNRAFCDDLLAAGAELRRVLDVGTGTARIPIEICARDAKVHVVGIDLARHMLDLGERNVRAAGLSGRIDLAVEDAKATSFADGSFDAVISNSIVHHIPEPARVFADMWRVLAPGGLLFVRDLARPSSLPELERLVDTYAPMPAGATGAERAKLGRQRALFGASLHAALTVGEVAALVAPLGIAARAVRMTSDRHWTLSAIKSR